MVVPPPGLGVGMGVGAGYGALAAVGLGPDRPLSNGLPGFGGSSSPSTPTTSAGSVAGMLGLGRAPTVYHHSHPHHHHHHHHHHHTHTPSHHPHYQNPEAQEQQRKLIDLEFQYHYVVDQLVYYSTIKTGENFFQLASLLFCTLLGNRIFQIWSPAYLKDPRLAANGVSLSSSSSSSGVGEKTANASGPTTGSVNTVSGTTGTGSGGANGGIEENESMDRVLQTGSNGFTMMHHGHGRQSDGEEMIRVWPESLRKWVEALDYFVSFFPYHTRQLETLKTLHHSLISS